MSSAEDKATVASTCASSLWRVATDAEAVHELLLASDAHHAAANGLPTPNRRIESSRRLVAAGAVQILCTDAAPTAMFTLTEEPPFGRDLSIFPAARCPLYLQRLAVEPRTRTAAPLLGVRALRRAVELAAARGADALRAEANPDLPAVVRLLTTFGFVQYGPVQATSVLRRIYLQKDLPAAKAG